MVRRVFGGAAVTMIATVLVACGGSTGPEPDPAITPFVGTWDADSLTLTDDSDPTRVANILGSAYSGSFVIQIEPSGQYTATITVLLQSSPEIGQLRIINGSTLTLTPDFPPGLPVATSTYVFQSEDYLVLDGASEFDFNNDGTPEPVQAHFELQRR